MAETEFRTACGEYAVKADWSEASCYVMSEGEGDDGGKVWVSTGIQVGDFHHLGYTALHWHLIQVAKDSGEKADDAQDWAEEMLDDARESDVSPDE